MKYYCFSLEWLSQQLLYFPFETTKPHRFMGCTFLSLLLDRDGAQRRLLVTPICLVSTLLLSIVSSAIGALGNGKLRNANFSDHRDGGAGNASMQHVLGAPPFDTTFFTLFFLAVPLACAFECATSLTCVSSFLLFGRRLPEHTWSDIEWPAIPTRNRKSAQQGEAFPRTLDQLLVWRGNEHFGQILVNRTSNPFFTGVPATLRRRFHNHSAFPLLVPFAPLRGFLFTVAVSRPTQLCSAVCLALCELERSVIWPAISDKLEGACWTGYEGMALASKAPLATSRTDTLLQCVNAPFLSLSKLAHISL
ncbi:hypothetical protein TRVL_07421 [Trypanosoma vivax]|nr:hypothetical protein TRVL_07421 [Trypanosoma vivax]